MIGDFKACGGIIIIAVGFKILNAYRFKVLNFLPALALVAADFLLLDAIYRLAKRNFEI